MMFSLIHATRGRPALAVNRRDEWFDKASINVQAEHIYGIDHDDEVSLSALRYWKKAIVYPPGSCTRAFNEAAKLSKGTILLGISDDVAPPKNWDELILDKMSGYLGAPAVLAVSDGHRQDQLMTMVIMTRARYEQQGHLICEEYLSLCADKEHSYRAYRDKVVIQARDLLFEHHHPLANKGHMDETYANGSTAERYKQGMETFKRRNPEAPI